MNKKIMLMVLAAASATMLAFPTAGSATPAHLDKAEAFNIAGSQSFRTRADGNSFSCVSLAGSGQFETTTTGTLNLQFNGCKNSLGFICTSGADAAGTVTFANLPFHIIRLSATTAGILITPPAAASEPTSGNRLLSAYVCFGVPVEVFGNGVIGTISSPECGKSSATATLTFESSSPGTQQHSSHTGVNYDLTQKIGSGAHATLSIDADMNVQFPTSRTLLCT